MRLAPALLAAALACACGASGPGSTRPEASARAGDDRLGVRVPKDWIGRWVGEPVVLAGPGAAPATLVRFWTDTCPYCEASLPALEELRLRHGPAGLATLAVYHPKPRGRDGALPDDEVRAWAAERSYRCLLYTSPSPRDS